MGRIPKHQYKPSGCGSYQKVHQALGMRSILQGEQTTSCFGQRCQQQFSIPDMCNNHQLYAIRGHQLLE